MPLTDDPKDAVEIAAFGDEAANDAVGGTRGDVCPSASEGPRSGG